MSLSLVLALGACATLPIAHDAGLADARIVSDADRRDGGRGDANLPDADPVDADPPDGGGPDAFRLDPPDADRPDAGPSPPGCAGDAPAFAGALCPVAGPGACVVQRDELVSTALDPFLTLDEAGAPVILLGAVVDLEATIATRDESGSWVSSPVREAPPGPLWMGFIEGRLRGVTGEFGPTVSWHGTERVPFDRHENLFGASYHPAVVGNAAGCIDAVVVRDADLVHVRRRDEGPWHEVHDFAGDERRPFPYTSALARAPSGALHLFAGVRTSAPLEWWDLETRAVELVTETPVADIDVAVVPTPDGEQPVALYSDLARENLHIAIRRGPDDWDVRQIGVARRACGPAARVGDVCLLDMRRFIPVAVLPSASGDVRLLFTEERETGRLEADCRGCSWYGERTRTLTLRMSTTDGTSLPLATGLWATGARLDAMGNIHVVGTDDDGTRYLRIGAPE